MGVKARGLSQAPPTIQNLRSAFRPRGGWLGASKHAPICFPKDSKLVARVSVASVYFAADSAGDTGRGPRSVESDHDLHSQTPSKNVSVPSTVSRGLLLPATTRSLASGLGSATSAPLSDEICDRRRPLSLSHPSRFAPNIFHTLLEFLPSP